MLFIKLLPKRVINKWPAIILAVKRTAKEVGRIKFLIDSIKTINGIKIFGVPTGTKWQNIELVLLIQPNNIRAIHEDRAIVNENGNWDEEVKT